MIKCNRPAGGVEVFTGLVQEIGTISALTRRGGITRIVLVAPRTAPGLRPGDSLAVNGICLTVTTCRGNTVSVEAVAETRRVTTLSRWRGMNRVQLEAAWRAGDPVGAHIVRGQVAGVGRVAGWRPGGGSLLLTVSLPPELARYLMPKGSVAVDGVSLTVDSGPFRDRFTVNVIPHTLANTRLGDLRTGQLVNLEMDVLVKAARGEGFQQEALLTGAGQHESHRREARPLTMAGLLNRGFRRRHRR